MVTLPRRDLCLLHSLFQTCEPPVEIAGSITHTVCDVITRLHEALGTKRQGCTLLMLGSAGPPGASSVSMTQNAHGLDTGRTPGQAVAQAGQ